LFLLHQFDGNFHQVFDNLIHIFSMESHLSEFGSFGLRKQVFKYYNVFIEFTHVPQHIAYSRS
jgi:hypothetical protein